MLEHVEQRHGIEGGRCETGIFERDGAKIQTARAAEFDRRRIQIDADRLPSIVARGLDDEARAAADVEIARRAPVHAQVLAHQPHALGAEAADAVLVAVDPEVANDVLIRLRRVHRLVVRLVERRIDEHQIALPAAHDAHVILLELERLLGAAARRTRTSRQQLLRNRAEARDEVVDRMRPLLDEALVRAARTQLADVNGLVFRDASVGNVQ